MITFKPIMFTPFHIDFISNWKERCAVNNEEEYVTLCNGYLPSIFKVDKLHKKIEFEQIEACDDKRIFAYIDGITADLCVMSIWQEWYEDLCMPGKTELLHTKTGMRSTRYIDVKPEYATYYYNGDKCGFTPKDFEDALNMPATVIIEYIKDAYFDAYALVLWRYRFEKGLRTYFKPMDISHDNIEKYPEYKTIDLNYDFEFNVPDSYINPYLVFCKTNSHKIFITDGERNAGRLLAYARFGNAMMYLPCGMNVFEDYYYMPLKWETICVKGDKVSFCGVRKDAYHVSDKLKSIINGIIDMKGIENE